MIKDAISKGEHCQVELRNYKKDGTFFWNELIISPVKDSNGNVTHFIGVQNDITRRKETETALKEERVHLEERVKDRTHDLEESESYMASIIETIRESLVVLNDVMEILTVNDHFCKFFKLNPDELIGKTLFELGTGQWEIPKLRNLLENVLPHNNPFEGFELENDFDEIGRKLLIINARQITLKGKYQDRILLAIEDITERRAIEQRKEDFISIASHEMKTPLTSIKGNIQLLQRKAIKNNDMAYLNGFETANKSIGRLDKLINDLLDVAKIQSGKVEFHFSAFLLNDMIKEAVEAVQATSQLHHISISDYKPLSIYADYGRLEQVVINLLSNAIKYSSSSSEVIVNISSIPGSVKISVADQLLPYC